MSDEDDFFDDPINSYKIGKGQSIEQYLRAEGAYGSPRKYKHRARKEPTMKTKWSPWLWVSRSRHRVPDVDLWRVKPVKNSWGAFWDNYREPEWDLPIPLSYTPDEWIDLYGEDTLPAPGECFQVKVEL